ncbi:MAG: RNA polymerase sigma factor [Acidimicrobiales bacterium]
MSDLAAALEESYPHSVRTAYLILGNRPDAEDAVQEAYLRAWKFRNSLAKETSVRPWIFRVVVNTCNSKLRRTSRAVNAATPTTIAIAPPTPMTRLIASSQRTT